MPAIKKPVRNRKRKRDEPSCTSQVTEALHKAAKMLLMKNSLDGEYLSARDKKANTRVPAINPSITAEVTRLTAYWLSPNATFNSGKIALPANHNEVPANCDKMISGRI